MKITFVFRKQNSIGPLSKEPCIIKKQWEMVPRQGDGIDIQDGNHAAWGTVQIVKWDNEGLPEVHVLGSWSAAE